MKNGIVLTHCALCGDELSDPESVERGIGPVCSGKGYPVDDSGTPEERAIKHRVRQAIYGAAACAQKGDIAGVLDRAALIHGLGYVELADALTRRFQTAIKGRNVKLTVKVKGDYYEVKTPFRRGDKEAFIAAWRAIPGRRYAGGVNLVPTSQRAALWALLGEFFPGVYGESDKGLFRVPAK